MKLGKGLGGRYSYRGEGAEMALVQPEPGLKPNSLSPSLALSLQSGNPSFARMLRPFSIVITSKLVILQSFE